MPLLKGLMLQDNYTLTHEQKEKTVTILENITITDVAAEGKALARVDDMVIFIPFVIPGDVVDVQITKKKKKLL